MFKLLLYLLVHFQSSYGNKCTVANEPALPSDSNQDFCLFSNYSKYELAKAGYKEKKLDVMLDFNVQNTQVDQDLNRWHASVLLSVTWPDHRILLKVNYLLFTYMYLRDWNRKPKLIKLSLMGLSTTKNSLGLKM